MSFPKTDFRGCLGFFTRVEASWIAASDEFSGTVPATMSAWNQQLRALDAGRRQLAGIILSSLPEFSSFSLMGPAASLKSSARERGRKELRRKELGRRELGKELGREQERQLGKQLGEKLRRERGRELGRRANHSPRRRPNPSPCWPGPRGPIPERTRLSAAHRTRPSPALTAGDHQHPRQHPMWRRHPSYFQECQDLPYGVHRGFRNAHVCAFRIDFTKVLPLQSGYYSGREGETRVYWEERVLPGQ